ncbi:MAG TPA: TAXI family TRAP transporter solute-binding subunit, partial [Isosphaeraceae bacterium]|nr:TAXI family TRAP transporter solute-binding subunit [Isosphaeraceae bacterium]
MLFSRKRIRWYAREWIAAALCLTALGVAVGVFFSQSRPRRYRLSISGGNAQGLRHQIAERLAVEAVRHGLGMQIVPSSGSREVLDLVEAHTLDLAFVQGGLDPAIHPHVRQIAALHVEPLHLLVKPAVYQSVSENLAALKGKTVNLGPAGSGTHDLSRDVLKFAGLEPSRAHGSGDYSVLTLSYGELLTTTDSAKLPDAIFTVSALPSPVVRALAVRWRYRLVPLLFGEAFALDALNRGAADAPDAEPSSSSDVAKVSIYPAVIPPFTYGIEPPTPAREVATFGPRLLMVANENVPARAVRQILETVFSPPFAQISKPPLDASLLEISPEYPVHAGAEQYRELNKPLMAGDVIDLLEKGTSLAGAVLGALFFLWQWMRQHFRRRRELGFES